MASYVPNTKQEREKMLEEAGFKSIDEMFADIPENARLKTKLDIPNGLSELEVMRKMQDIAGKNKVFYLDIQRRRRISPLHPCYRKKRIV